MIKCDPDINFGQPALKGRRLTVYDIVTKIYYEDGVKASIDDYEISLKDAKDAVNYCMNLKCKKDRDLLHYCDGCILRTIAEGLNFKKDDYIKFEKNNQQIVVSKNNKVFFAGSLDELENSEFGKVTWLMAEDISKRLLTNI